MDRRGARRPAPQRAISRARASCGRSTTRTDYLLDLHSMTDPCPPLALAGRQRKGLELAHARRRARAHRHRRAATRPAAAARLRVLRRSGRSAQRAAGRVRPALGARGARRRAAGDAALPAPLRHGRRARSSTRTSTPAPLPPQRAIEVTDVVTIATDAFAFALPVHGPRRRRRRPARCSRATAAPRCARPTTTAC